MKNILRGLRFFRPDISRIAVVLGLLILSTGANLLKPWPLALIVDHLLGGKPWPPWLAHQLSGGDRSSLLALLAGAIVVFYAIHAGLTMIQNYLLIQTGLRGLARVRHELFHWLLRLSLRYHQGARQGDLIYRASWDTYAFQTLFQHVLFTFLGALLSLALMVVVMWQLNRPLALVALSTVPLLLLAMQGFGRGMRQRTLVAQDADSHVTTLVQQNIVALPLTQSFTREHQAERRFHVQVTEALRLRMDQHAWEVFYLAIIAVIFGWGIAGIAWLGVKQVWAGQLTIGQLLVFLAYLGQFYEPLNQLSHVSTTVATAKAGTQRVFEILDTPEEVKEQLQARPVIALREADLLPVTSHPLAGKAPLVVRGALTYEHVSFQYQPDRPVLRDICFSLDSGQAAAIVGPSGAGKSTLIHFLPRFFDPTEGVIRLDGTDLRELRLKDLRTHVALVMQEPILLPATIAENIAYGKPEATRAEIEAAAREAHADYFIQSLPRNYDTLVGEGAVRLSVGEKQRINLARAFLKNAPLLILDEPTSSLDAESEALVIAGLQNLMKGRTTMIVTHRLATIQTVDQILVLEGGCLTAIGSPEKLLRQEGYFARIAAGCSWKSSLLDART